MREQLKTRIRLKQLVFSTKTRVTNVLQEIKCQENIILIFLANM